MDCTSVFNPGAVQFGGRYLLMVRAQSRSRETFMVMAESPDGVHFTLEDLTVDFKGLEQVTEKIYHIYDARITRLDETYYIMFAMDMDSGCQLGLGQTDDFKNFRFLGITSNEDIRNGVLFPEKIGGKYLRLDRPNRARHRGGPTSGSTIWLSSSDNLINWAPVSPVIDMGVPGHDERDFAFATRYGLPIVRVLASPGEDAEAPLVAAVPDTEGMHLVNSGQFSGHQADEGLRAIVAWLERSGAGKGVVRYRLHDWCISRQRYWGPPIPVICCDACGAVPVPEQDLPVLLPPLEDFRPDDTGVSPWRAIPRGT